MEWKDEGIIIKVEIDQDDLIWLLTRKNDEIPIAGSSSAYDKEKGILTLTENLPFQNFKNSLPEDKENLAGDYYRRVRIATWMEDFLRERDNEEKDKPCNVADVFKKA